jgi:hypothetical protein
VPVLEQSQVLRESKGFRDCNYGMRVGNDYESSVPE